MALLDKVIVGVIIVGGLFIMYKALKEPVDMVGRGIKNGFIYLKEQISGMGDNSPGVEVISYG